MYIFASLAFPFIWLTKLLAELFRVLSNVCYWLYYQVLGFSIWLNDITESDVWPKE